MHAQKHDKELVKCEEDSRPPKKFPETISMLVVLVPN